MKKVLAALPLAIALIFCVPSAEAQLAGYANVQYFQVVNLRNNVPLTGYQVKVQVDHKALVTKGLAKADGSDVRFTDCTFGTQYPLYIESGQNTSAMVVWVKVLSTMPARDSIVMAMHTGNPAATSVSDPQRVFDFFDDFSDASLAKWERTAGSTVTSGWLNPSAEDVPYGGNTYIQTKTDLSSLNNRGVVECVVRSNAIERGGTIMFFADNAGPTRHYGVQHDTRRTFPGGTPDGDLIRRFGTGSAQSTFLSNFNYQWNGNESVLYTMSINGNDNIQLVRTSLSDASRTNSMNAGPTDKWTWRKVGFSKFGQGGGDMTVDWVRIRQFASQPVDVRAIDNTIAVSGPTTFCDGSTVILTAPPGFTSYLWSDGKRTRIDTVSKAGSVSVKLFQGTGCELATRPVAISVLPRPTASAEDGKAVALCDPTQSATFTADAGFVSYNWYSTSNATGPSFSSARQVVVNTAGPYSVVVRSANGCTDTAEFFVHVITDVHAKITTSTGLQAFCVGDSLVLRATPPGATYAWKKDGVPVGGTADSLVVRSGGEYNVTTTIGEGITACVSDTSITITQSGPPAITLPSTVSMCDGDTTTLDAGPGYASYLWSTGDTTQSIKVVTGGTFTLRVGNEARCYDSARVVVTISQNPTITVISESGATVMCENDTLTLAVTGTVSGLRYKWNTGDTTRRIVITGPGTYSVEASGSSGCAAIGSITIAPGSVAPPTISYTGPQQLCPGQSATLTIPADYDGILWSTGDTTNSITVSTAGTYTVTVRKSSCTGKNSITVEQAPSPSYIMSAVSDTTVCGDTIPDVVTLISLRNNLALDRAISVSVSGQGFTADPPQFGLNAGAQDVRITCAVGSQRGRLTGMVVFTDQCGWQDSVAVVIDVTTKSVVVSTDPAPAQPVRTGEKVTIDLHADATGSLSQLLRSDTLIVQLQHEFTALDLSTVTSSCGTVVVQPENGPGNYKLIITDCREATSDVLGSLTFTTLIGTTLRPTVHVRSISSTSVCVIPTIDTTTREIELLRYGCELSTVNVSGMADGIRMLSPQPVLDDAVLEFGCAAPANVRIELVDVVGRSEDLFNGPLDEGLHRMVIRPSTSGSHVVRLWLRNAVYMQSFSVVK
ncbi:MAG: DUF2341 domain-containing protein [Bacteroidetes bacterium]|nr:DUF2341 domain-containing protein [Bacteroidota bacterium]